MVLLGPERLRRYAAVPAATSSGSTGCSSRRSARVAEASDLADRDDILSLLLQATPRRRPPDDVTEELRDELMTLLVAGHETTATGALLGGRAARAASGRAGAPAQADGSPAADGAYLDAVIRRLAPSPRHRAGPAQAGGADGDRRPAAPGRAPRWRPRSTSSTAGRRSTPSPQRFRPERFLDQPAGTYTWIPFGGRRAALSRRAHSPSSRCRWSSGKAGRAAQPATRRR